MSINSIDAISPAQSVGGGANSSFLSSSNSSTPSSQIGSALQQLVMNLLQNLTKATQPEGSGNGTQGGGGAPKAGGATGANKAAESSGEGQGSENTLLELLKALLPLLQALMKDKGGMSATDSASKVSGQLSTGTQGL